MQILLPFFEILYLFFLCLANFSQFFQYFYLRLINSFVFLYLLIFLHFSTDVIYLSFFLIFRLVLNYLHQNVCLFYHFLLHVVEYFQNLFTFSKLRSFSSPMTSQKFCAFFEIPLTVFRMFSTSFLLLELLSNIFRNLFLYFLAFIARFSKFHYFRVPTEIFNPLRYTFDLLMIFYILAEFPTLYPISGYIFKVSTFS